MKKIFYILLAIVNINQILGFKSYTRGYNVELSDEEFEPIKEKTTKFGNSITLSDIKKCPDKNKSKSKTIKQCYDEHKSVYEGKIRSFNEKITEAGKILNNAFKANYLQQVNAAQQQLTNIIKLLKMYPDYLSKTMGNFLLAKNKMANNSFTLRKYLEGFYVVLMGIQKSGENKANEFYTNFQKLIVEDMQKSCADIVQQIKKCMGEDE